MQRSRNEIDIKPRINKKTHQDIESNLTNIPKTKEELQIENEQWFIESKLWIIIICITLLIIITKLLKYLTSNNSNICRSKYAPPY